MKRSNIFWGLILLFVGGFLLSQKMGFIPESISIFGLVFPFALILIGIMVITGMSNGSTPKQDILVPLEGATRLDVELDHGAGLVRVNSDVQHGMALAMNRGNGMDHKIRRAGDALMVKVEAGPSFIPFLGPEGHEWILSLSKQVPVSLNVEAGATKVDLDLSDVKLSLLKVSMGAADLHCALPKNAGTSIVDVESGLVSVSFDLPAEVGAKVLMKQGATSTDLDMDRFEKINADPALYQTKNYASAANKVDINLEGGMNSIVIK